jgi:branched-chain amino acid transport system permease protein
MWGTLIGGLVLGVAQSLGAQIHPQGFLIAGHVTFLLVLLSRLYFQTTFTNCLKSFRKSNG